ncbi:MAG: hypothetical protein EOO15_05045 [Chitinophagaceae bacterium]|nr:MAG: hypothetical protein EOO15_05045 [Chitinophagaceae bacterium]
MGSLYYFFFRVLPLSAATMCVLAGCRVEEDEYPEIQLPPSPPPPPPPPVVIGDSSRVALDTAHWSHYNLRTRSYSPPGAGVFEFTPDGVQSFNDAAGFGSVLATAYSYSLTNRDIRIIWRCYDGGASSPFRIALADSSGYIFDPGNSSRFRDLNNLSTRTAYGGATVILNNSWYYTTLTTTGNSYTISTAAMDFAENGGFELEHRNGTLPFHEGRILLRSDQPARNGCSILINQLRIR